MYIARKYRSNAAIFILALSLSACGGEEMSYDPVIEEAPAEEDGPLLPFRTYDIGASFTEINEQHEHTLQLEVEVSADTNLKQAIVPVEVFDRPAELEWNFRNMRLYSYYYTLTDSTNADSLYKEVQQLYSAVYGPYSEEEAAQEQLSRTSMWDRGITQAVITYIPGAGWLSWGLQEKPEAVQ